MRIEEELDRKPWGLTLAALFANPQPSSDAQVRLFAELIRREQSLQAADLASLAVSPVVRAGSELTGVLVADSRNEFEFRRPSRVASLFIENAARTGKYLHVLDLHEFMWLETADALFGRFLRLLALLHDRRGSNRMSLAEEWDAVIASPQYLGFVFEAMLPGESGSPRALRALVGELQRHLSFPSDEASSNRVVEERRLFKWTAAVSREGRNRLLHLAKRAIDDTETRPAAKVGTELSAR
jgi:hypothetical protein